MTIYWFIVFAVFVMLIASTVDLFILLIKMNKRLNTLIARCDEMERSAE